MSLRTTIIVWAFYISRKNVLLNLVLFLKEYEIFVL